MTKRKWSGKRGPQDTDRLVTILERAVKGETFDAIGKSLDPPLTRERVRQLLKTLNVTSTDFVRVRCDNCGDPIRGRHASKTRKTRDGKHYCSKPECRRIGKNSQQRAVSPSAQLPRAVCASCGDVLKHPPRRTDGTAFCDRKKECRAARMRHYYATSEYHREYSKSLVKKAQEAGYFREYAKRYKERKPITHCRECGEETGSKYARWCKAHRSQSLSLRSIRVNNARRLPHPSIAQFRVLVHDPNFARLHALHLLKVEGLSEREVAKQTGFSRSALNGWSLGVRLPTLRTYFND